MNRYQILCICALMVQHALGQEDASSVAEVDQPKAAANANNNNLAANMKPMPAQVGPYGPYANMYGQVPMTRPAWPYPQPVGQPGPYYSGGAQSPWATLPLMANPQPQQQQVQPQPRATFQRAMPQQPQQPTWNQQPLRPYLAPNTFWASPTGSVSSGTPGVQEVPNQQEQQQQPQQQQWNNYGYPNANPWANAWQQPQYQQYQPQYQQPQQQLPIWRQPQAQIGQWMPVTNNNNNDNSDSKDESAPAAAAVPNPQGGWVAGAPNWRRSYTPISGQSGCYSRCKPSCSRPSWGSNTGYGCQPSCRNSCNVRPSCGLRGQVNWAGNTMVCGRQNAGWGGANNWGGAYGQPQQYNPYAQPAAAAAAAAEPAQESADAEEEA